MAIHADYERCSNPDDCAGFTLASHARARLSIANCVRLGEIDMTRRAAVPMGLGMVLLVLTGTVHGQNLGPPQPIYGQAPQVDSNQKPPLEGPPGACAPFCPPCDRGGCFVWAGLYCLQPVTL